MSKPCTTLGAAAGKNLAAVAGVHSLAEAVLLRAMTLLRLIGANQVKSLPSDRVLKVLYMKILADVNRFTGKSQRKFHLSAARTGEAQSRGREKRNSF